MVQKRRCVLWAKAHLKWTVSKWKNGQTSPNLTFLLEITDAVSSELKRRETFQRVISVQFKSQHLWWYWGDNAKPHTAAITTAWLHSRRVRVLNWPACSPDLSPIENVWCIIKRKYVKDDHELAAGNLYQARMGPNSNTKTPETHNLNAQTSSNCFEKKRRCYTMVNMPPSQLFETCSRHQIWNELILCIKL